MPKFPWVLGFFLGFNVLLSFFPNLFGFFLYKNSFLASSELRFSEKLSFEGTKSLSFDNFWLSFWKAWVLMPLSFEPNCETKSLRYCIFAGAFEGTFFSITCFNIILWRDASKWANDTNTQTQHHIHECGYFWHKAHVGFIFQWFRYERVSLKNLHMTSLTLLDML